VVNFTAGSFYGPVPSLFAFDNVSCSGNETNLNECPHLDYDDCTAFEGAGVFCSDETADGKLYYPLRFL
jgi:hypothetical protein